VGAGHPASDGAARRISLSEVWYSGPKLHASRLQTRNLHDSSGNVLPISFVAGHHIAVTAHPGLTNVIARICYMHTYTVPAVDTSVNGG
jgi:hypothetical protein